MLGAGLAFEHLHLPALRAHPRFLIDAVYDPVRGRAEPVCAVFPAAELASSAYAVMAKPGLDAIVVLTPPESHAELTLEALAQGRAVLVEKPMTTGVDAADAVVRGAREVGRPVLVGYNRRHRRTYRTLRARLGRASPRRLEFKLVAELERWSRADGGSEDLLDDLGSHGVDLLPWIARRRLAEVRARAGPDGGLRIDGELEGGVEIRMHVTRGPRYIEWLVAEAREASWFAHPGGVIPARIAPPPVRDWIAAVGVASDAAAARLAGRPTLTWRSMVRLFDDLAARLDGRPGLGGADAAAGRRAVEAVWDCRVSLESGGRPVRVGRAGAVGPADARVPPDAPPIEAVDAIETLEAS
ncbi:MAG: Gfo/Idh/MocA family protein [Gemmatimonadota bacterium]